MAALRNLVLPYGTTSGKRLVLDGVDGEFDVYNASNVLIIKLSSAGIQLFDPSGTGALFAELTPTGGVNSYPGLMAYQTDGVSYVFTGEGNVQWGVKGQSWAIPPVIESLQNTGSGDPLNFYIRCGAIGSTTNAPQLAMQGAASGTHAVASFSGANGVTDLKTDGNLYAGSRAFGAVTITPSAANTPTSIAVTGLSLTGANPRGYATAFTSVPGTQVTGVSVNNITTSGMNVWLTRTNTTATIVNWSMESG